MAMRKNKLIDQICKDSGSKENQSKKSDTDGSVLILGKLQAGA